MIAVVCGETQLLAQIALDSKDPCFLHVTNMFVPACVCIKPILRVCVPTTIVRPPFVHSSVRLSANCRSMRHISHLCKSSLLCVCRQLRCFVQSVYFVHFAVCLFVFRLIFFFIITKLTYFSAPLLTHTLTYIRMSCIHSHACRLTKFSHFLARYLQINRPNSRPPSHRSFPDTLSFRVCVAAGFSLLLAMPFF